jgi:hypothetical protein
MQGFFHILFSYSTHVSGIEQQHWCYDNLARLGGKPAHQRMRFNCCRQETDGVNIDSDVILLARISRQNNFS